MRIFRHTSAMLALLLLLAVQAGAELKHVEMTVFGMD
jgi:hypothetical protein